MNDLVIEKINLPPVKGKWGMRAKAAVVLGIQRGVITREQACAMYELSLEELETWEANFGMGGHQGLIATKAKFWAKKRRIQALLAAD